MAFVVGVKVLAGTKALSETVGRGVLVTLVVVSLGTADLMGGRVLLGILASTLTLPPVLETTLAGKSGRHPLTVYHELVD